MLAMYMRAMGIILWQKGLAGNSIVDRESRNGWQLHGGMRYRGHAGLRMPHPVSGVDICGIRH